MLNFKYFFLSFLCMFSPLFANDVAYSFAISNDNPYEKEALLIEVNLTQIDHTNVMLFKFSLKNSDDYEFHQVDFKEHEKYHDLREEYVYLVYPKKSGEVFLEFEMIKSITDDDKVAYSISGDRDNVKGLQKEDIVVTLKPLLLNIKPLPKNVDLVGEFSLTHALDRKETEAYDPVNLKVKLKGKGFLSSFKLLETNKAYRLFTQNPKFKTLHTKQGSNTSLEWDYAISAKENFTLEKIVLKAFNPKSEKLYDLVLPFYSIEVNKVEEASLLDDVDYPARTKGIDWAWLSLAFSYVVVFVAGLLMPRDLFRRKKISSKSSEDILNENIKNAKTHKELLKILLVQNDAKFSKAIGVLEGVVYNGEKMSLSKIKALIQGEKV